MAGGNRQTQSKSRSRGNDPSKNYRRNNYNENAREYEHEHEHDYLDEVISQAVTNKRGKASITHLLDIHYNKPGWGGRPVASSPFAGVPKKKSHYQMHIDKQAYLRITCRFILDPDHPGNTSLFLNDPDAPVPYSAIMRVIAPTSQCPICLEGQCEAPRMLECGHILCLPCLLRYLADESMGHKRECPLCFDRFIESKIRPVTFSSADDRFDAPQPGTDCVFRLFVRPTDSLILVPRSDLDLVVPNTFRGLPSVDNPILGSSARIMMGSYSHEIEELSNEIVFLTSARAESEAIFEDNGQWYTKAISEIRKRITELEQQRQTEAVKQKQPEVVDQMSAGLESVKINDNYESESRASYLRPEQSIANLSSRFNDSNAYFFYQTGLDSTTKFFLAPLDIRILKAGFGTYSQFPSSVVVKVEHVSHGQAIDDSLRKKIKYLGYLPSHTSIALVECDWQGIVDSSVLAKFQPDISKRRQRWRDIRRKEDHAKKMHDKREQARLLENLEAEQSAISFMGSRTNTHNGRYLGPDYDFDPALPGGSGDSESANQATYAQSDEARKGNSTSEWEVESSIPNFGGPDGAERSSRVSFADAAAGKGASVDIDDLIFQAQQQQAAAESAQGNSSGKKGRKKKLVLLSNGGASMYGGGVGSGPGSGPSGWGPSNTNK